MQPACRSIKAIRPAACTAAGSAGLTSCSRGGGRERPRSCCPIQQRQGPGWEAAWWPTTPRWWLSTGPAAWPAAPPRRPGRSTPLLQPGGPETGQGAPAGATAFLPARLQASPTCSQSVVHPIESQSVPALPGNRCLCCTSRRTAEHPFGRPAGRALKFVRLPYSPKVPQSYQACLGCLWRASCAGYVAPMPVVMLHLAHWTGAGEACCPTPAYWWGSWPLLAYRFRQARRRGPRAPEQEAVG